MKKELFSLKSDYDGLLLHGVVVEPTAQARGVVQITHGMCEYKERYEPFMDFLAQNGYIAVCYDQRGHGDSVESQEDLGWFRDFDGKAFVQDAVKVTTWIKERYPNLPITLFGHSMGSMIVRCYIQEHDDLIDKLIVCGSPSKNPLVGVAILLVKLVRLFKGERHRSNMLAYLSTGKGDELFPGEGKGAWLSKNYECTNAFYANPKGKHKFTCNGFENLFKLMKCTYTKKAYKVKNPNLPIYFVSGEDDAVKGSAGKWGQSLDFLYRVGGKDNKYRKVTGKLYKGLRHEILNEPEAEIVYSDLLKFIESGENFA